MQLFLFLLFILDFTNTVYTGLIAGTVIFAASGRLAKVWIGPVNTAFPSNNPKREMRSCALETNKKQNQPILVVIAKHIPPIRAQNKHRGEAMFLHLFGYQFPLLLGAETAQRQNAGIGGDGIFGSPVTQLVFTAAAFSCFYEQFTPEEQRDIVKRRPFFSVGLRD